MPSLPTLERTRTPQPVPDAATVSGEKRRVWLLTLAYFCVIAVGVLNHEMWRDEWQAWLLARDSSSIAEVLRAMEHEGHPPGWYLLLFVLSRFTRDPLAMQALHVAVATASVYLLARFSPLPWLYRILIAFGYFLVFEYSVIARSYAMAVFALFAFCALFRARRRHAVPLVASLAVLATVSVYGLILSIAASCALLYDRFGDRYLLHQLRELHLNWKILLAAWLILAVGAVIIMRPPQGFSGRTPPPDRFTQWGVAASVATVASAYAPVPELSNPHPWNSHILPARGRNWLAIRMGIGLLFVAGSMLLFARQPAVLLMYGVGSGGLLFFQHMFYMGTLRHHGHLFVLFLGCLWLAHGPTRTWRLPRWLEPATGTASRSGRAFVLVLLGIQCVAGALLYSADLRRPFSAAPMAARFLTERGLHELPMVVSPAPAGSSLAGLLDRPVYYPATQSEGTFIRWGHYVGGRDWQPVMMRVRPFLDSVATDEAIVVLGRPRDDWDDDLAVTELARFDAGLERTERYVLYHVRRLVASGESE
jgi:hypothetical protein